MMKLSTLALALPIALLASCGSNTDPDAMEDEIDISDYAGEEKGGETYSEFDDRRDSFDGSRGSFEGDGCTEDCGGHEAGYEWAQEKGITDPDDCGGNSWSFEEGCRSYAGENEE